MAAGFHARSVDVSAFIDAAALRGVVSLAPFLCALLMVVEGVDTFGIGYVGPFLSKTYGISPQAMGMVYTATIVGSLIGAVAIGPLADNLGRRTILIGSSLLMATCAFATPMASSAAALFALRLAIGVAFGAAVPSASALTADYVPARVRGVALTIVSAGVALGVIVAALSSSFVIPAFGWQAIMYLSGALSLLCAVVMALGLPESIRFVLQTRPDLPASRRLVARLLAQQGADPATRLTIKAHSASGTKVLGLFRDGRGGLTFTLWFVMAAVYAVQFLLSYWLPTLLLAAGVTVKATGLIASAAKVGSIAGGLTTGWLMDRKGAWRVLACTCGGGAVAAVVLGASTQWILVALALIIVCYFLIDGSFGGVLALTASSYPPGMRATGTGWVSGLARLVGGGGGTMLGGFLVAAHWSLPQIAALLAAPMAAACLALLLAMRLRAPSMAAGVAEPAAV